MAVVRINFVRPGPRERTAAKGNIRYIQHRSGRDGARTKRTLFGLGGEMTRTQAYEMVDQFEEGARFFRIKICPDPNSEDTGHDLLMREITGRTLAIEERIGGPVAWVAAIHDDHTDKRHIHVLAVAKARYLPAKEMIRLATDACLEQRRALDLDQERGQQQQQQQQQSLLQAREEGRIRERERSK
jgi:hypothetical protein